ncbi:LLM class flavin-dependent oxidoreductase [Roseomonas gilardii]|uniref:LLM class flavin-dependent oxidoreductase n=1 Tax=Roseomonas gilardii TaxID=257708 RepID=UPI0011AA2D1D|nr:LLM class flavin-dependent oxidoreductase [Roseomonas gilardii]
MSRRSIHLGLSMIGVGYHAAAWRHPRVPPDGMMDFEFYRHVTHTAERGLFDMVFLADGVAVRAQDEPRGSLSRSHSNVHLEPLTLLSGLAVVTRHIGLVATASTTYNEPYHIARKFASLDHLSHGRAGWNAVTSWTDAEARNFNRETHLGKAERYERAMEFLEVVRGLWDSWDEGAFLRDKDSGRFYDEDKLHVLDHRSRHFSVRGPLNVDRSPQGHPVIVQAGASDQGQEMAAAAADVIFAAQPDLAGGKAYYRSVKGRMARYGRDPDTLKVLPGLSVIVGRTEADAQEKHRALQDLVDPLVGLAQIVGLMGDLSEYDVDGPVPDLPHLRETTRGEVLIETARRENLTIRQLYMRVTASRGHLSVVGTPAQVADLMQHWMEQSAADGFNILPPYLPGGIEDFVELVVPELQRRGLYREAYESHTLRGNLGLPEPVSRYAGGGR